MPGPLEAAEGAGIFYYLDVAPQASPTSGSSVLAVPAEGGPVTNVFPLPGPDASVISLRARSSVWGVLYQSTWGPATDTALSSKKGSLNLGVAGSDPYNDLTYSPDAATVYIARAQSVLKVAADATAAPTVLTTTYGGARIAVDSDAVYLSTGSAVVALDPATGIMMTKSLLAADNGRPVVFAQWNGKAFAAGSGNAGRSIVVLKGAQAPVSLVRPTSPVVSFAVENESVYWTDGVTVWRAESNGSVTGDVVYTASDKWTLDHLSVYAGCLYFWSQAPDATSSALRVIPAASKE
jgi:hypothetical protein